MPKKYIVYLRIDKQGETPNLLRLAEFEDEQKAREFLDALRQLWMSSAYMKEE